MTKKSGNGRDAAQRKNVDDLERTANGSTDGQITIRHGDDCPPEIAEEFWKQVVAYEEAPSTTHFNQLQEAGVELPAPESLNDSELKVKLWEVIYRLARMGVYLEQTNHLDDRSLYIALWNEVLREETMAFSFGGNSAWHIDLLGSYDEEDTYFYMKYYANDDRRQDWLRDFPDYKMPEHEDPPYDRDADLPQSPLNEFLDIARDDAALDEE